MGVASVAIITSGRGNWKGLYYTATETVSEVHVPVEEKGEEGIHELEIVNILSQCHPE